MQIRRQRNHAVTPITGFLQYIGKLRWRSVKEGTQRKRWGAGRAECWLRPYAIPTNTEATAIWLHQLVSLVQVKKPSCRVACTDKDKQCWYGMGDQWGCTDTAPLDQCACPPAIRPPNQSTFDVAQMLARCLTDAGGLHIQPLCNQSGHALLRPRAWLSS